jgi:hypothetical protein
MDIFLETDGLFIILLFLVIIVDWQYISNLSKLLKDFELIDLFYNRSLLTLAIAVVIILLLIIL